MAHGRVGRADRARSFGIFDPQIDKFVSLRRLYKTNVLSYVELQHRMSVVKVQSQR